MAQEHVVGKFIDGMVTGIVATLIVCLCFSHCNGQETGVETVVDTVVVHDTVRVDKPVEKRDTLLRYVKKKPILLHDTLYVLKDSDNLYTKDDSIYIPITQKEYSDDSTYRAWVSGYQPSLDSLNLYRKQTIITKTNTIRIKPKWSWGLQGGVYVTPKGLQPGIGIGAQYTF